MVLKADKKAQASETPELTAEQKQSALLQSRFNLGPTEFKTIGTNRDLIVEHLEKNTKVDPRIARVQVDEFFDGPAKATKVKGKA